MPINNTDIIRYLYPDIHGTSPSLTLNSPSNGGTSSSLTPTLTFTGIASSSAQNIAYEVQLDTVNTFDSLVSVPILFNSTSATTGATFPTSVTSTAFPNPITVGNTINVALMLDGQTTAQTTSVTDTAGNGYVRIGTVFLTSVTQVDIWSAVITNPGTGVTITANGLGNTTASLLAEEWSNIGAFDKTIQASDNSGTNTAVSTGASATTTFANEFVWVAGSAASSTATFTAGSGYSNKQQKVSSPSTLATESKIVSSTGTQTGTFTLGAGTSWAAVLCTFKIANLALIDAQSSLHPGFADVPNSGDLSPFPSPDQVGYTIGASGISRIVTQTAHGIGASATVGVTYPGATTAGDLLIAVVSGAASTNAISGWTLLLNKAPNGDQSLFYKLATGSETTITATCGSGAIALSIFEYKGNANPIATDGTAVISSGASITTTLSTSAITTTSSNDLVLAFLGSVTTLTASSWVKGTIIDQNINSGASIIVSEHTANVPLTPYTDTANWTNSLNTAAMSIGIAAFKGSAANVTLTNGTIYYWRVRAVVPGNISVPQGWSAPFSFTAGTGGGSASITQVAATITATGGSQTVAGVATASASVTQVAATLTTTGGTQTVATVNVGAVSQVAAAITATGGTQSVASVSTVSITQTAASITANGGTQSVQAVQKSAVSQVAATLTITGGNQSVATANIAAVAQSHATLTANGGTQTVTSVVIASVSITQAAATLTVSGGTQAVSAGTVAGASVTQVAAVITATGGSQPIATVRITSVSQAHATLTVTGSTQTFTSIQKANIAQVAAILTVTGGTHVVSLTRSASITQAAAVVTVAGGSQSVIARVIIPYVPSQNIIVIAPEDISLVVTDTTSNITVAQPKNDSLIVSATASDNLTITSPADVTIKGQDTQVNLVSVT